MQIRENLDHRVFLVPDGNIRQACQGTARCLERRENPFHLALNGVDRHFSHVLYGNTAVQWKSKRTDEQEGIEANRRFRDVGADSSHSHGAILLSRKMLLQELMIYGK